MIESNQTLAQLAAAVTQEFLARFNRAPRWITAAPGRVNLIGEHTDYNDGFVLPMAIDRYTIVAADRSTDSVNGQVKVNWQCARTGQKVVFPMQTPVPKDEPKHWSNYVRGVFAGYQSRGILTESLDAVMLSTVPLGGGLSSSAALEIATATLIETVSDQPLDPVDKALLAQQAEHGYAGVPCGIMDQFVSTLGKENHLLLLDCRSRRPILVPWRDPDVAVLILNTNVRHQLGDGEYAQRRRQCEEAARTLGVAALRDATMEMLVDKQSELDPQVFRRARHVISEIERTFLAAQLIPVSNWPAIGQLMYDSHQSLRNDYEVSCPELDVAIDIAQNLGIDGGVYGCRMTGGGFGGCTVAIVKSSAVPSIAARMSREYEQRTRIKPALFLTRPAAGAMVLKSEAKPKDI
jgi:galactokinase